MLSVRLDWKLRVPSRQQEQLQPDKQSGLEQSKNEAEHCEVVLVSDIDVAVDADYGHGADAENLVENNVEMSWVQAFDELDR